MAKERVIIYALGNRFRENFELLNERYDIIACSDKNRMSPDKLYGKNFIEVSEISNFEYDKLIICSNTLGIKEWLLYEYEIDLHNAYYFDELFLAEQMSDLTECDSDLSDEEKNLTIVIPTYNRRERLRRTLKLLEYQTEKKFQVIILDNASNYVVEELLEELEDGFVSRIEVRHNRSNIGLCGNITKAMCSVEAGWFWVLSDDDIPYFNAVENIYKTIAGNKDAGCIMLTVYDTSKYIGKDGVEFTDINELLAFYNTIRQDGDSGYFDLYRGEWIYISNKIFRADAVIKEWELIHRFSSSAVPFSAYIFALLKKHEKFVMIDSTKIIRADTADGDRWNIIEIAPMIALMLEFPIDVETELDSTYKMLFSYDYKKLFSELTEIKKQYIDKIERMWWNVFRYCLTDSEKEEYQVLLQELKTNCK